MGWYCGYLFDGVLSDVRTTGGSSVCICDSGNPSHNWTTKKGLFNGINAVVTLNGRVQLKKLGLDCFKALFVLGNVPLGRYSETEDHFQR